MDRNKVAPENKVQLLAKGEEVFADGFGNEGTGGHSHWIYNWKAGETYKFLVTAATDSASSTTSYAGYFFIPEIQRWKLITIYTTSIIYSVACFSGCIIAECTLRQFFPFSILSSYPWVTKKCFSIQLTITAIKIFNKRI